MSPDGRKKLQFYTRTAWAGQWAKTNMRQTFSPDDVKPEVKSADWRTALCCLFTIMMNEDDTPDDGNNHQSWSHDNLDFNLIKMMMMINQYVFDDDCW